jgi:DNA (cytosine-5)-methyltransferase 1
VLAEIGPPFVFLENVPGLVQTGLRDVWRDLRELGYQVEADYFSAAEVGAPHRRNRVFLLAHAHGYAERLQQGRRSREDWGAALEPSRRI